MEELFKYLKHPALCCASTSAFDGSRQKRSDKQWPAAGGQRSLLAEKTATVNFAEALCIEHSVITFLFFYEIASLIL